MKTITCGSDRSGSASSGVLRIESAAHSANISVTPRTTQRCVADHSMMRSIMSVQMLPVLIGPAGVALRRAGLSAVAGSAPQARSQLSSRSERRPRPPHARRAQARRGFPPDPRSLVPTLTGRGSNRVLRCVHEHVLGLAGVDASSDLSASRAATWNRALPYMPGRRRPSVFGTLMRTRTVRVRSVSVE